MYNSSTRLSPKTSLGHLYPLAILVSNAKFLQTSASVAEGSLAKYIVSVTLFAAQSVVTWMFFNLLQKVKCTESSYTQEISSYQTQISSMNYDFAPKDLYACEGFRWDRLQLQYTRLYMSLTMLLTLF